MRNGYSILEIAAAVAIAVILGTLLLSAVIAAKTSKADTNAQSVGPAGWMSTVEYDGHRWVILETGGEAALAHHPDCPCGSVR